MIHLHWNKIGAMEWGSITSSRNFPSILPLVIQRSFLLVNVCRFSANTQIISTDSGGDSVRKENIVKNSQSFQAFGFKPS